MSSRSVRVAVGPVLLLLVGLALPAHAADWPQYRGPERDGVSSETGLAAGWPDGGPPRLWRVPLGNGYSGISVVGDRLYTMFGRGDGTFLAAFKATDGSKLWERRVDSMWKDRWGDGPRSTPTVVDGTVYALSARGRLMAVSAASGEPTWSVSLPERYGAEPPTWGMSASPHVIGELLVVDVGGKNGASVVAFDRVTGEERWRAGDDPAGYSAPVEIRVGERPYLVIFNGKAFLVVDPADGTIAWREPWKTSYEVNASTPIAIPPDRLFISTGYDVGAALYRVVEAEEGDGVEVRLAWKNREMKNKFQTSVLLDRSLYGFDEKVLKSLNVRTGETRWQTRGDGGDGPALGHGSLLLADGKLIMLGDKGTLVMAEASPEAYRELGRVQLFEGKTWTVPTLSGGRLYVRDEHELVALDVGEPADSEGTEP